MADETYNGWRNVETWRVQLHLANDEQTAATVAGVLSSFADEPDGQGSFADWLRTFVSTRALTDPEHELDNWGQFASDTLQAALGRVDWEQLAGHWGTIDIREQGAAP